MGPASLRSRAHSLLSLPVPSLHGTWTFGQKSLCLTSSQLPSEGHVESVLGRDEPEPPSEVHFPSHSCCGKSSKEQIGKAGQVATIQMLGAEGEAIEWQGVQEVPQDESAIERPSLGSGSESRP